MTHGLEHGLARTATRHALASYAETLKDWSPEVSWRSDDEATVRFVAMGKTLEAGVTVDAREVTFQIELPFLFRAFQKQAIATVEAEVNTWIKKAKNGELDG